jgi:hypothetical protein
MTTLTTTTGRVTILVANLDHIGAEGIIAP